MPAVGDMPANSDISQFFVEEGYLDLPKITPPPLNPDLDRVRIFAVDGNGVASLVYQADSGFTARMFRDLFFIAYNGSGSTLTKGCVVAAGGAHGNAIDLVLARGDTEQGQAIGFAAQDIPNGAYGRVMVQGRLDGINTAAFSASLPIWLSATSAGTYVASPPTLPGRVQQIGSIIVPGSATAGAVRVDVRNVLNVGLPNGLAYLDANSDITIGQLPDIAGGHYGDGSDGDVTVAAGVSILTRDMLYRNLTVSSGATLRPNGYRICVQQTFTCTGTIDRKGTNGAGVVGGAALAAGTLGASGAGGNGGINAANGVAGSAVTALVGTVGSAGVGGATTKLAGSAGTVTILPATYGTIRALPWAAMGMFAGIGGSGLLVGGPGGGGGAGATAVSGGGGGAGGGPIVIVARRILNTGAITAAGGNGASATTALGGAGGGGGGGPLVLVYSTLTNTGTVTAAGGAAGATGIAAAAGTAGPVILIPN